MTTEPQVATLEEAREWFAEAVGRCGGRIIMAWYAQDPNGPVPGTTEVGTWHIFGQEITVPYGVVRVATKEEYSMSAWPYTSVDTETGGPYTFYEISFD